MKGLYIGTCFFVLLISVILVFIFDKKRKIKNLKKDLQEIERQRNIIISTPIMSELSKIQVIIKNEKLESKYDEWIKKYEILKNEKFGLITDKILEVDEYIENKSFDEARDKITDLEMEIYKLKVSTDNLLDDIREITMSEEKNRAIVTKLKTRYRELEEKLEKNKRSYGEAYKYILMQLENIEKKFSDFEMVMEKNEYEEVISLVKVLDEMIAHISVVVEEMPDLVLLTTKILPSRIKEVNDTYNTMESNKFPLDYLKIPYNITEIEKKIKGIVDKVKMLNLEDSLFELKTFLDYLDNLLNDLDIEKSSKKIFDKMADSFKKKLIKINTVASDVNGQLDDLKNMYDLSDKDLAELYRVNNLIYEANKNFNEIITDTKEKIRAYSSLKDDIEKLTIKFGSIEDDLNSCLKALGSMHEDEQRAREQLDEISDLLKDCRSQIRKYPLPIIANQYFVELSEANEAIGEIIKELSKSPITIKILNIRVDTARDLALKLFSTTNEMLKTARLCEMTIVYGNRYKVLDEDIEDGLDTAGKLFFRGDYTKALEVAITSINIIEPNIYEKMLTTYKNEKA